jgi:hypothetical protein
MRYLCDLVDVLVGARRLLGNGAAAFGANIDSSLRQFTN